MAEETNRQINILIK